MGITANFMRPAFPNDPGMDNLISLDEYHAVMELFPCSSFTTEGLKQVLCGLCCAKTATIYDNFIGEFGARVEIDGRGGGKEGFAEGRERKLFGLSLLEELDIHQ